MNQTAKPSCDQLHQEAMHYAELAVKEEKMGEKDKAIHYFQKAYHLENQAAMMLAYQLEAEPSRSVLFRSAAYLAIKATKYRKAERMAAFGLIGYPPSEIAIELRAAFKESQTHLKLVA